ncbi:HAMP domain-containing sensor histidine kinase [Nonomuraea sp. NEAU-A123]|uniref:sensor histidine kinase n=1 Tax=Nonomuraea sp. NEAU-A123 TaxID=2839649 RepID=UPI001BE47E05|nr:HAMP domain-containing sensor histidine kinase [Nonomuraea sp. NEAU-A123]MBT2234423.1 HAMP domain-containing histidine kinase [Nonomuraea sp. NEAU-A123]
MNWLAVLADWDGRWRYPALLVEVARPAGARLEQRCAERILDGIAEPVSEPRQAIEVLLERGEFGVAQGLAGSGLFPTDTANDIADMVRAAQEATKSELARRRDGLIQRAQRAQFHEPPPAVSSLLRDRRQEAVDTLNDWESRLHEAEAKEKARLTKWLTAEESAGNTEWADAVQGCLDAGEFPAAERLLEAGPAKDVPGGPHCVPRWAPWPWSDRELPEILRWYRGGAAPPGFRRHWCPVPDDVPTTDLLATLEKLNRRCDQETVRDFAAALDHALGAGRLPHEVEPYGTGFRTHLAAVSDYRLPWLDLPKKIPLYIGPPGWTPSADRQALWFVPGSGTSGAAPPPGVAVLDATTILRLIAPERTGDPANESHRRVNLLREIGGQLRVADVLGEHATAVLHQTSVHETRDAIAWCLDLLGVHPGGGVMDTLLYDTGAYLRALRVALEQLAPDGRRPVELTVEDLAAWRQDRETMADFHERVLAPICSDREVAVLLHVALMIYGERPDAEFTVDDLGEYLAIGRSFDDLASLAAATRRAITGVLFEGRGTGVYGWSRPGLAALLSSGDMEARLDEDFEELTQRRLRTIGSATLHLQNVGLTSAMHQVKTNVFAVKDILSELAARNDHPNQLARALLFIADLDEVWALSEPEGAQTLLKRVPFDLCALLRGRRHHFHVTYKDVQITLQEDAADPLIVWGSRPLVKLALDNLLNNAVRAAQRTQRGTRGRVHLSFDTESLEPGKPPAWARIGVEDSGCGIPPELRRVLLDPDVRRVRSEYGGGVGVRHAQDHITYNGGMLEIMDQMSGLGGAHLEVWLPLAGTPDH